MANPWMASVKATGKLTVFNRITAGKWINVFKSSLASFNKLNTRYGLGVEMVEAEDEAQANVVIHVSDGMATYEYANKVKTKAFNHESLHGGTFGFVVDGAIEKAAIFLPSKPQTQAGFRGGKMTYEKANLNMMRVIAVHELIHACCLDDNKDHADDGVFVANLTPVNGKLVSYYSGGKGTPMPPMFLAPATVAAIQRFWS